VKPVYQALVPKSQELLHSQACSDSGPGVRRAYVQGGNCRHVLRELHVPVCCAPQSIPHGSLDVNSLAVIPQQPNIVATCCDEPEVRPGDLTIRNSAVMLI
jgi:hypothetical protein